MHVFHLHINDRYVYCFFACVDGRGSPDVLCISDNVVPFQLSDVHTLSAVEKIDRVLTAGMQQSTLISELWCNAIRRHCPKRWLIFDCVQTEYVQMESSQEKCSRTLHNFLTDNKQDIDDVQYYVFCPMANKSEGVRHFFLVWYDFQQEKAHIFDDSYSYGDPDLHTVVCVQLEEFIGHVHNEPCFWEYTNAMHNNYQAPSEQRCMISCCIFMQSLIFKKPALTDTWDPQSMRTFVHMHCWYEATVTCCFTHLESEFESLVQNNPYRSSFETMGAPTMLGGLDIDQYSLTGSHS